MTLPATNYVKVSITTTRDVTDGDATNLERRHDPASGQFTSSWVFPFRGHSYEDGLRAYRAAEAKRKALLMANQDLMFRDFQLAAFCPMPRARNRQDISLPVIGEPLHWRAMEIN